MTSFGIHVVGFRMPAFEGAGAAARRRNAEQWFLTYVEPLLSQPTILVGDFNRTPEQSFIRALVSQGWQCPETGPTFRARNGNGVVIDYAFFSRHFTIDHARASWEFENHVDVPNPGPGILDHAALLVDFRLKGQAE